MHNYPSDISREEFEIIRQILENAKKKTKPRKTDLYDIFCAILYVIKGGIQWRMLPSDFPKWTTVYFYFQIWSRKNEDDTTLHDEILKKLVKMIRAEDCRLEKTSFCIVDAQSVQNSNTAESKGYDAGKKSFRYKASYIAFPHDII